MMVQTEIGLLPEDWEVVRLEDQFKTFSTASFSRDHMSEQGEVMCIHYGDIHTKFGNIVEANSDEIPFVSATQASRYKPLKDGDVLLADASEDDEGIGKPIAVICHDKKIIAGLHILPLRPKNNECWDVRFPSYLFSGRMVKGQVEKLSEGTKVNSITYNKIKDVLIPLPKDKTEQQNIASALSSIDKLIDDLGRTIQKKQRIREGAMEELLSGKRRLPGFTEEWVENTFDELFKPYSTASYSRDDMIEGNVLCIHYGDIHTKYGSVVYLDSNEIPTITKEQAGRYTRLKDGDIIMADASEDYEGIGKCIAVITCGREAIAGLHTILLRPKANDLFDHRFTSYILSHRSTKKQIEYLSEGTKVNSISFNKIKVVTVTYPSSLKEQGTIADILTSMDDEISLLESERAKYEQIRSGMMEELLTGKKRLK